MAITVTHSKVSAIPDGTDTSVVRPSDWNATHTLVGVGTAASLDAGVANGVATLDSGGQVPLSQLPPLGDLNYQGAWNANTNSPTLTSSTGTKGYYYVVSVAGTTNLNGITDWQIGDWAVFNGSVWQKIDNTDAVTSVNGKTGIVVLTNTDISGFGTMSTQNANNVTITGGTVSGSTLTSDTVSNNLQFTPTTAPTYSEGDVWYDSTQHSLAYYNDATNSLVHVGQEVQTKVINNTGSTITIGAPVYVTSTSSGQIYPNVALAKADSIATSSVLGLATQSIANGAIGYVTSYGILQPCNTGLFNVGDVLYLSPYTAGVLMNTLPPTGNAIIVGVVAYKNTPNGSIYVKQVSSYVVSAGTITGQVAVANGGTGASTLTGYVKGSGTSVMTASATIPTTDLSGTVTNAQLANSAITINGASTSLGGSISVGTVTSVTGTSPVVSSGGTTPAISMPAATTSVNGYLTSTDWNTFNGKSNTNGTVTSVAALTLGTTGTDLSSTVATGTTTPVITLQVPTASASNRGALSSTDWSTFNGKQAALVSGTNIKTVAGVSLLGAGDVGIIGGTYGGTGVNNGANTITVGGNVNYSGAFTQTWTRTANTSLTLPVSGTVLSSVTAPATNPITGTPTVNTYLSGNGTWATLGTGVATALAVNTGSAGAMVLFNGALGTPTSGTVTNLTGTASININGTVGATTASTGAFTTLTASTSLATSNSGTVSLIGTGAIAIGATTATTALTVGQSTVSQTTNIQAGATASASTKAINIGTGGLAGSTTTIIIGSTAGTSTTTVNGTLTAGTGVTGGIAGGTF